MLRNQKTLRNPQTWWRSYLTQDNKTGLLAAKYQDRKTTSFKHANMYFWICDVQVLKRNGDNRQQYIQKWDHTIWILVCIQSALNFESLFPVLRKVPQRPCLWIKKCWTSSGKCICFCTACRYKISRETYSCAITSTKAFAGAKK